MSTELEDLEKLFSELSVEKRMLYHLYDSGPKAPYQLEKELHIPESTVHRIVKNLNRNGALIGEKTRLTHSPKRGYWNLKAFGKVLDTYHGGKIPIAYVLSEPYKEIVGHMKEIDRLLVEAWKLGPSCR
jgi:DNA-binding Lrp family transcriptional regulator